MSNETFDGYTRITKILGLLKDEGYWNWVIKVGKKEANRIKKEAMAIGSNVDAAIRAELDGGKAVKLLTMEAKSCFAGWERFKKENEIGGMVTGKRLFSEELKVTGEPDLELADTIIDIKCANSIREEYWWQTEFYARIRNKRFKAVLRLDKNLSDYEYKKMPVSDECWEAVRGLIKVYEFLNKSVKDGKEEV